MEIHDFCVGDRVICATNHLDGNPDLLSGDLGVVCYVNGSMIGVRWDKEIAKGHSCSCTCDMGHGWFVASEGIKHDHSDIEHDYSDDELVFDDDMFAGLLFATGVEEEL